MIDEEATENYRRACKEYDRLLERKTKMKGSWKTTTLGILTLLGAVASAGVALLDGNPATVPNFAEVLAALTGLGLVFARDNNVSSEDAGAK